tara:strand:- start:126 stop:494 length:369 start_codon:yes stop_codon:yes gene_type:complete
MALALIEYQLAEYDRDGFTIVKDGFAQQECDRFVGYMMDLQAGRTTVEGYAPRTADDWSRLITRNCHHPMGLSWMIDPRLRKPLSTLLGEEPVVCLPGSLCRMWANGMAAFESRSVRKSDLF